MNRASSRHNSRAEIDLASRVLNMQTRQQIWSPVLFNEGVCVELTSRWDLRDWHAY
ncbi:hypothetical protein [Allorhodopirellula heiligendammensis]|uniref:hypothetical protein n=1 Tax=Allorhodopirellula heiligendammensis TaxID=2714739 RepID=UPI00265E7D0A|nr:hypothetical protein [Allorhodopirellula heiligendammensis]